MIRMMLRLLVIFLVAVLMLNTSTSTSAFNQGGGHNTVWLELRSELPELTNAGDYSVYIDAATPLPSTERGTAATAGWLGIYHRAWGVGFWQVGFTEDMYGVRFFAYSEWNPVNCTRGYLYWYGYGCIGDVNDFSALDSFRLVEIYNNGSGTWYARVYNDRGQYIEVGNTYSGNNFAAEMEVASEEAWTSGSDPHIMLRYYHYHPKYWKSGVGWTEWLPSNVPYHDNYIWISPSWQGYPLTGENCQPEYVYGAVTMLSGDPRAMFLGTGGPICYKNPVSWNPLF